MPDCIVIGGGIIGLLTARELAAAGAEVMVLDRRPMGQEASWAGGGILSPLYPWRYPEAVTALARRSQQTYPALARALFEETEIDPEYTLSGLLVLETDEAEAAHAWAGQAGQRLEQLTPEQALLREPALGLSAARDALWFPDVAQVRNPRLAKALCAGLRRQGVALREYAEVRALRRTANRIEGVELVGERMNAGLVVVAAGAWSAATLGPAAPLPVEPVRGQMILLEAAGVLRRMVLDGGHYLIPRRDGHILAGSTLEYVGFDASTTATAREELLAAARRMVPALATACLAGHWAGLRPGSPQGIPFIGPHPRLERLWINTGHFRNGLLLAPASAALLRAQILGQPPDLDPAPYAVPLR